MSLRKDTELRRRTVDTTGKVIVGPEKDADSTAVRCVQVVIPESVEVSIAIGPQQLPDDGTAVKGVDDAGAYPADIAEGRIYQWPEPDAGNTYSFRIRAGQWVAAMAKESYTLLTVIVEYEEG